MSQRAEIKKRARYQIVGTDITGMTCGMNDNGDTVTILTDDGQSFWLAPKNQVKRLQYEDDEDE